MTDKEAKQLAERTHAILKSNPALDLLVDIAHSTPRGAPNALFHGQLILAVFDIIGSNIEKFEKLSEPLTGPISGLPCTFNIENPGRVEPFGRVLKKDGTPTKKEENRHVYQSNMKDIDTGNG